MKHETMRKWLIFWTLFIGVGALAGGVGMLSDPSGKAFGMDATLPYFQKLPFADKVFQDLSFSGVALIIVNGLTQLVTAGFALAKKKLASSLGIACGIVLMLWICIQFYFLPLNFMSSIYFVFGLVEMLTGIFMFKAEKAK